MTTNVMKEKFEYFAFALILDHLQKYIQKLN